MLSMVSFTEITRKVAYKQNVGSITAKLMHLKIKNNIVQLEQYNFKVKSIFDLVVKKSQLKLKLLAPNYVYTFDLSMVIFTKY